MDEIKYPFFTFSGSESLSSIGKTNFSFDAMERDDDNDHSTENDHQYTEETDALSCQFLNEMDMRYSS